VTAHEIGHEHEHVDGGWNAKAGFVSDTDHAAKLFNTRGKPEEIIAKRARWLADQYDAERTPEQQARAAQAREKYRDAIAINSLLASSVGIIGNTYESFTKGVKRNIDAGMTLASATVFAFPASIPEGKTTYDIISDSDQVIRDQELIKVETVEDIRRAKATGKMALMYNTQGADYVAENPEHHARKSYEAGIRMMNFVYNNNNMLSGGSLKQDMGLTELGERWVKAAQAANIVVDVSHSSNQAAIDAARIATKPIMATHSNSMALHENPRNATDEALKAVASTGGVVCPTGVGIFLNEEGDASPERYAEHVVYISDLIGRDRVCYATDYVHNIYEYYKRDIANTEVYPPELGFGAPMSNANAENIWDVVAILEDRHGWSDEEIRGFLGENLMRVYAANWK
jgi:microsomal dipeptidase-like Zn-dependent dipeptidase